MSETVCGFPQCCRVRQQHKERVNDLLEWKKRSANKYDELRMVLVRQRKAALEKDLQEKSSR